MNWFTSLALAFTALLGWAVVIFYSGWILSHLFTDGSTFLRKRASQSFKYFMMFGFILVCGLIVTHQSKF